MRNHVFQRNVWHETCLSHSPASTSAGCPGKERAQGLAHGAAEQHARELRAALLCAHFAPVRGLRVGSELVGRRGQNRGTHQKPAKKNRNKTPN